MGTAQETSIEALLASGRTYVGSPFGCSMLPMLASGRDTVVVEPLAVCAGRPRIRDVVLFHRDEAYVLHRVVRVLPGGYVTRGDNCEADDGFVPQDRVLGVLVGFFRGAAADADSQRPDALRWRAYGWLWCALYPLRRLWKKVRRHV